MNDRTERLVRVSLFAFAAQSISWLVLVVLLGVSRFPYEFFYLSDTAIYYDYAVKIAAGLTPYVRLNVEYPPLAIPFFTLPGHLMSLAAYQWWFAAGMIALSIATGVVAAVTAALLHPTGNRPYVVGALCALGTLLTGSIMANRYDAAVALVLATVLLLLVIRRPAWAAFALGLGFALKLTPVVLLPLVLIMSEDARGVARSLAAFAVSAVVPFLFVLGGGGLGGLDYLFRYHLSRPLEIETLFASPLMVAASQGWMGGRVETQFGSQVLLAPGAQAMAVLATPMTIAALGLVYWLIWRRRVLLRSTPRVLALAVLAVLLGFITFGKVLSPQYLIWLLPALALVAVYRRSIGIVLYSAVLLTQVLFPANYFAFAGLDPGMVLVVAARNLLLVGGFFLTTWNLWQLPAAAPTTATRKSKKR